VKRAVTQSHASTTTGCADGLHIVLMCLIMLASGCGPETRYDPESHWEEGKLGVIRQGMTVGDAGGCSTSIINPLSIQLIDEINCLRPDTLVDFTGPNMSLGPAVFPFLQGDGPQNLMTAIQDRGERLSVTSALRTLPQQFLLYKWYQAGQCGISLAARPGRSRHESGLSIDINGYASWRADLEANRFSWLGASDPVHFDYTGPGRVDLAGLSVEAFQRLWNRNNPGDQIAEDGIYGPQTEARIRRSPIAGFPVGACDPAPPVEPDLAPPPPAEDMDPPEPPMDAQVLPEPEDAMTMDTEMPRDMVSDATQGDVADTLTIVEVLDSTERGSPPVPRRPLSVRQVGGCMASPAGLPTPGGMFALLALSLLLRRRG